LGDVQVPAAYTQYAADTKTAIQSDIETAGFDFEEQVADDGTVKWVITKDGEDGQIELSVFDEMDPATGNGTHGVRAKASNPQFEDDNLATITTILDDHSIYQGGE